MLKTADREQGLTHGRLKVIPAVPDQHIFSAITPRSRRRPGLLLRTPDGTHLLRVVLPRWSVLAGAVVLSALVTGAGVALYRDHQALRDDRAQLGEALPRMAEQQALLDAYRTQARALAGEVSRWRELHARILDPFGPDAGLVARDPGVGGAVVASTGEPAPEFGVAVVLDHGNDTKSLYGHLSRVTVAANQTVQRGDVIAFTGTRGARRDRICTTRSRWPASR